MTTNVAPFDLIRIRSDFPLLAERAHDHVLAYLDNANTTQKPLPVLAAIDNHYRHANANIHRASYQLSERATAAYEGARAVLQRFVNAAHAREIILTKGTTEGINLVAQSWGRTHLAPGDEVLLTGMEHHSNIVPWQLVCAQTGAIVKAVPVTDAGTLDTEAFEHLLTKRTRLVSMVHVSNALGTLNPVAALVARARDAGAVTLVDGAQAAPHLQVDVQSLGCDFYVCSSHKSYGPTGAGLLYGRTDLLERMPPYQGGGDMIASVTFDRTEYAPLPHKFEAGTANVAGAVGFAAAVEYLGALDRDAVAAHEADLLAYATAGLRQLEGVRILARDAPRVGVVAFVVDNIHAHDVGTLLDAEGIAVRTGQHCAQPLMDRLGIAASVRASFALYNTRSEIDRLLEGVQRARRLFA